MPRPMTRNCRSTPLCAAHTRLAAHGGLADLVKGKPGFADHAGSERCDEDRAVGAVIPTARAAPPDRWSARW